jgi:hypothetical protein
VRRSSFHGPEEQAEFFLQSPYRCEECGERFFVISRKARRAMLWMLIVLALLIAYAVITFMIPAEIPQEQPSKKMARDAIVLPSVSG